jgi:hypothetical protein
MTLITKSNLDLIQAELENLPEHFYGTLELRFVDGRLAIIQTSSTKKFNEYLDRTNRKVNHGGNNTQK